MLLASLPTVLLVAIMFLMFINVFGVFKKPDEDFFKSMYIPIFIGLGILTVLYVFADSSGVIDDIAAFLPENTLMVVGALVVFYLMIRFITGEEDTTHKNIAFYNKKYTNPFGEIRNESGNNTNT